MMNKHHHSWISILTVLINVSLFYTNIKLSHLSLINQYYIIIQIFLLMIEYRKLRRKRCSNDSTGLIWYEFESIILNVKQVWNVEKRIDYLFRLFLRTCKTVSRKPCINRVDKMKISQFSYTTIVVTITMKFLAVLTTTSIYHDWSTHKTFW